MSYWIGENEAAFATAVKKAIDEDDDGRLRELAQMAKRQGYDDIAETLIVNARQANRNNFAYDEHIDNYVRS